MEKLINLNETNFDDLPIDEFWNLGNTREKKMHRIHSYPAKFPAFITEKALDFAKNQGLNVSKIADVFCGCGTVAFEAKRNNIDFWGCDINPVATLIAKVKSRKYSLRWLQKYYSMILAKYESIECENQYQKANPRLQYWYDEVQYTDLFRLKMAIDESIPISSEYRSFFICAFSNILKASSRWLTKSIKPQIDPNKTPSNAVVSFKNQVEFMIGANEDSDAIATSKSEIITGNILKLDIPSGVDMIVSSPPYVTSYEYADLHQLSSLWLNYTSDYRDFRKGSIGSIYNEFNFQKEVKAVNNSGQKIVFSLYSHDKAKARSVAKYFLDMQKVASICYEMINTNGLAIFVIGNTEYKGVRIDNVRHLAESLFNSGFKTVLVTKRKISNKILTPYRDKNGKFTTDVSGRKIYSEEFILCGRKDA